MRFVFRLIGNLLLATSAFGALGLGVMLLMPESSDTVVPSLAPHSAPLAMGFAPRPAPARSADNHLQMTGLVGVDAPLVSGAGAHGLPISHLSISSIDLSVDVVPADMVERDGGWTWTVPAFKVGHAVGTAGAGDAGTALLLGHVESLHSGNVFATLDRVGVGDSVRVTSENDRVFDYDVVSVTRVPRDDTSAFAQTDVPSLSMVTCAGIWLPTVWDFSERLVVRAELARSR